MLTNTLLALKATVSHRPETKQQAKIGTSDRSGSMSSRNDEIHDALFGVLAFSDGGLLSDDSPADETLALRGGPDAEITPSLGADGGGSVVSDDPIVCV